MPEKPVCESPPAASALDAQVLLRGILDNSDAAIFVCDKDSCLLSVNKGYERIVGLKSEDIVGRSVHELYSEEDARLMHANVAEVHAQGRPRTFEAAFTFQGERRWFICSLFALSDSQGSPAAVAGIVTEITERKQAERQLQSANRVLRVLDEAGSAVLHAEEEAALADEVCRILVKTGGYSLAWVGLVADRDSLALDPVAHCGLPEAKADEDEGREALLRRLWQPFADGDGTAWRALRFGRPAVDRPLSCGGVGAEPASPAVGGAACVAVPFSLRHEPLGLLAICSAGEGAFGEAELELLARLAENLGHGLRSLRAEKQRREAEEALRESEARYRALFEKSSEGVFLHDLEGNILDVNQAAQQMFGYSLEELRRLHPSQLVHPDERDGIEDEFKAIVGNEFQQADHRCLRKDGSEILVITRGKVVTPSLIQGVVQDVTDMRRAERALQQSEARYRAVVEDQTEVISRFKSDGFFSFVNDVYCRVFGKTREELLAGGWKPVCLPEDLHRVEEELRTLGPDNPVVCIENRVVDGQGKIVWMQFVNRGFFNDAGELVEIQSVGRDITNQKQMQAEAIRSARLASLGELAAGVAHEVNNPLNGIINCAQLLADEARSMERDPRFAELILQEGRRVAQIVSSLLSLARDDEGMREPLDPAEPLRLALDLVQAQMEKTGVALRLDVQAGLPRIHASRGRLQQVFLNLLRNAHQALLRRKAEEAASLRVDLEVAACRQGRRDLIRYTVADTGEGLQGRQIPRLFEPFYSTRPSGEGTGLGLAISRSIVERLGGEIQLFGNEAGGVTVVVQLPVGGDTGT